MKFIKGSMLVIAELLLGLAIYKAIEQNNFVVVGTLGLPFLVLAYLGYGLKVRKFEAEGIKVEGDNDESDQK